MVWREPAIPRPDRLSANRSATWRASADAESRMPSRASMRRATRANRVRTWEHCLFFANADSSRRSSRLRSFGASANEPCPVIAVRRLPHPILSPPVYGDEGCNDRSTRQSPTRRAATSSGSVAFLSRRAHRAQRQRHPMPVKKCPRSWQASIVCFGLEQVQTTRGLWAGRPP